jgi:hypothetical protein
VEVKYLAPLDGFDFSATKGKWFIEGTSPLPFNIPVIQARSTLPFVIAKDKEIVIKDSLTGKTVLAVYRNRIGPDALEIMQETIKEMMQIRRKVARSNLAELNQGSMAAAGYFIFLYLIFLKIYIFIFFNYIY